MSEQDDTAPGSTAGADRRPLRFGPPRVAVFPSLVLFLCALPLGATGGPWLLVLLLPVACVVWVLRARVVLSPYGVEVCNGLLVRRVAWADVDGFRVPPRGWIRLLRKGSGSYALLALPRRESGRLLAAARAVAPGAAAPS